MDEQRAFTSYYDGMSSTLINQVTIEHGTTITVSGQWDTGATNTCISHEVVKSLGLISTGKRSVRTPSGSAVMDTYIVDILLPNNVRIEGLEVTESEIGAQGIGALIGMDIISQGDFAVSNFGGKTIFTFRHPSQGKIDFARDAGIAQKIGPLHGKGKRKKK